MAESQNKPPRRLTGQRSGWVVVLVGLTFLTIGLKIPSAKADGDTIDPSELKLTFNEDFKSLSVSPWGPGTRWIAHTPWAGDFGNAKFDDPGVNGPFTMTPEGLKITAKQDAKGKWHAGLLSSMDSIGPRQTGFAQKYGYFEMSAKLPSGPGVWPAFWLVGTDRSLGTSEFDVMEFYGHANAEYRSTVHFWGKSHDTYGFQHVVKVPPGLLSSQFNTYGVLITPVVIKVYFNRQEVWVTPTRPEFKMPMYVLANLALGGGWPIKKLQSPQVMDIQYIRVYQTP